MQSHLNEHDQQLIMAYLYDELSDEDKLAFEARLKSEHGLQKALEQQQQFDELLAPGVKPIIENKRMDAVHWSLQRKLRKQAQQKQSFGKFLASLWSMQVTFKAQFASVLVAFVIGFVIANQSPQNNQQTSLAQSPEQQSPLQFIQQDDYEITDLQLSQVDPQTGKVKVTYSLASQTELQGNLQNQEIQSLFATTMKNEVSDSTRLDLIELMKDYASSEKVRDSLSYSLLNDPNPGVRMVAAESLAKLSHIKSVRSVLNQALREDINSGIRVEIFQALSQHLDDQEILTTIKNYSTQDSNLYIRRQAQLLVNADDKRPARQNPKNLNLL